MKQTMSDDKLKTINEEFKARSCFYFDYKILNS